MRAVDRFEHSCEFRVWQVTGADILTRQRGGRSPKARRRLRQARADLRQPVRCVEYSASDTFIFFRWRSQVSGARGMAGRMWSPAGPWSADCCRGRASPGGCGRRRPRWCRCACWSSRGVTVYLVVNWIWFNPAANFAAAVGALGVALLALSLIRQGRVTRRHLAVHDGPGAGDRDDVAGRRACAASGVGNALVVDRHGRGAAELAGGGVLRRLLRGHPGRRRTWASAAAGCARRCSAPSTVLSTSLTAAGGADHRAGADGAAGCAGWCASCATASASCARPTRR